MPGDLVRVSHQGGGCALGVFLYPRPSTGTYYGSGCTFYNLPFQGYARPISADRVSLYTSKDPANFYKCHINSNAESRVFKIPEEDVCPENKLLLHYIRKYLNYEHKNNR